MRVLLTGASGFIGGHVAERLAARGHELRVLARTTSDLSRIQHLPVERVTGDLRDPDLGAACAGMDAVVHVAAVLRGLRDEDFLRANADGTGRLAAAAAAAGVSHFLLMSSLAVAGPSRDGRAPDPSAEPRPLTIYARSKALAETAALRHAPAMRVLILRPPLVYGPGDRGLLPFFRMAERRWMVRLGRGRSRIAVIHGRDLAEATAALLESDVPSGSIYHVCDAAGEHTWNELAAALGVAVGKRLLVVPVPGFAFSALARASEAWARLRRIQPVLDRSRAAEMREGAWLADSGALCEVSGWQPAVALPSGLDETVRWYREQGWV